MHRVVEKLLAKDALNSVEHLLILEEIDIITYEALARIIGLMKEKNERTFDFGEGLLFELRLVECKKA